MKTKTLLLSLTSTALLALSLNGQTVLQLDFGPTTPTGANLTNSPYHTESGSMGDTTWNVLGTADVASGLLYSNGSAATGVSVNIGVSPNTNVIDFNATPGSTNALGTTVNTGVFAAGSVGRDGIFSGTGTQNNRLGLQISGLAPGEYDIYVVSINTNQPGTRSMEVGAMASGTMTTWDTTGFVGANSISNVATDTSAWVLGTNYMKLSVTLDGTNDVLSIFTNGLNSAEQRGFLNSVQIVAIPEPSTYALIFAGLAVAFVVRRRFAKTAAV